MIDLALPGHAKYSHSYTFVKLTVRNLIGERLIEHIPSNHLWRNGSACISINIPSMFQGPRFWTWGDTFMNDGHKQSRNNVLTDLVFPDRGGRPIHIPPLSHGGSDPECTPAIVCVCICLIYLKLKLFIDLRNFVPALWFRDQDHKACGQRQEWWHQVCIETYRAITLIIPITSEPLTFFLITPTLISCADSIAWVRPKKAQLIP